MSILINNGNDPKLVSKPATAADSLYLENESNKLIRSLIAKGYKRTGILDLKNISKDSFFNILKNDRAEAKVLGVQGYYKDLGDNYFNQRERFYGDINYNIKPSLYHRYIKPVREEQFINKKIGDEHYGDIVDVPVYVGLIKKNNVVHKNTLPIANNSAIEQKGIITKPQEVKKPLNPTVILPYDITAEVANFFENRERRIKSGLEVNGLTEQQQELYKTFQAKRRAREKKYNIIYKSKNSPSLSGI